MRHTVTTGFRLPTFIALALLVLGTSAAAQHHDHHGAHMGARDLSHASPGSVGVSAERLERLALALALCGEQLASGVEQSVQPSSPHRAAAPPSPVACVPGGPHSPLGGSTERY